MKTIAVTSGGPRRAGPGLWSGGRGGAVATGRAAPAASGCRGVARIAGPRAAAHALRSTLAAVLLGAAAVGGLGLAEVPAAAAQSGVAIEGVVNVNTASIEELQLLPGVGPARARAILEAREHLGGFKRVEDLLEVKGIGPVALEKLRPFVAVKGRTTARFR